MDTEGTPHTQHKGGQFWQLEVIVGASGPGWVLWLRLSSATFSVGSSPAPGSWERGESALQSERGAASRHPLAAGAGWAGVLWSERCCTVVLACGAAPWFSIFPALVSPAFAEGRGSFSSWIPTLSAVSCWQGSCELVWDGQPGPPTVVHNSCRGTGRGFRALGRIPGPPPIPCHSVLMSLHPGGTVLVPLLSTAPPLLWAAGDHPLALGRDAMLWLAFGRRSCCSALFLRSQGLFPFIFSL